MRGHIRVMSDPATDAEKRGFFASLSNRLRIVIIFAILIIGAIIAVISQRQQIAREYLSDELEKQGIDAIYEIEEIGLEKQIIKNIKIGNPKSPDATIDRLIIDLRPVWGSVVIDDIYVEGLRLFGRYKDSKFSLGSLDPYLQSDSDDPPDFPEWRLTLTDARAQIDTDYGMVGLSMDGSGYLQNGFTGNLAAISDTLDYQGCKVERPTLYGEIAITSGKPQFEGPIRFDSLICSDRDISVGQSDVQVAMSLSRDFKSVSADTSADIEKLRLAGMDSSRVTANSEFAWNQSGLSGETDIRAANVVLGDIRSGQLAFAGSFSAPEDFANAKLDGEVQARRMRVPDNIWTGLSAMARDNQNTPLGPLLTKFIRAGRQQTLNMSVTAPLQISYRGGITDILLETVYADSMNGNRLFSANAIRLNINENGLKNATGEFAIVGDGLPQLQAEFDALSVNSFRARVTMPAYASGTASLALPVLVLQKNGSGAYGFSGRAVVSGPLPDGYVRNLQIPLNGGWTDRTGLRMYNRCQTLQFADVQYANIRSDARKISVCPNAGSPIISQSGGEYIVSARLPDGQFDGFLGNTPIDVQAESFAFSFPGQVRADDVRIIIGKGDSATRITAEQFSGSLGEAIRGNFSGAIANIANVPLNLTDGEGSLVFANSILEVQADRWRVSDQAEPSRFESLVTHDARLRLENGIITATAMLHEPSTDIAVMDIDIRHDLNSSRGGADLNVAGVNFGDALQPEMLTGLALGVVANVQGQVRGQGRIDWSGDGVVSTGKFRTDNLDLAAAFGPVTGLSGEIEFSDLLGLETAPGQQARMAEVNPGISALDGLVRYQLLPGQRMKVEGGEWPFAGGKLFLEPTILDLSEEKTRNLVFRIEGMDAAKFLLRFDFDNLAATGVFDGRLPMVFDQNGGRIEGGRLDVRSEGGTLAYVGQITYEDLGTMGNFAFNTLKSLQYEELTIKMDGPLDGEIVTDVKMTGVRQGEGAQQNFITREIAKLPIIFNVKITAPFMQLIRTGRSLYDPEYILDPVATGIIGGPGTPDNPARPDGTPELVPIPQTKPKTRRENDPADEDPVQPMESENMR